MPFVSLFEFKIKVPQPLLRKIEEFVIGKWAAVRYFEILERKEEIQFLPKLKEIWHNRLAKLVRDLVAFSESPVEEGEELNGTISMPKECNWWYAKLEDVEWRLTKAYEDNWSLSINGVRFSDGSTFVYGTIDDIREAIEGGIDTDSNEWDTSGEISSLDLQMETLLKYCQETPTKETADVGASKYLKFSEYDDGFTYPDGAPEDTIILVRTTGSGLVDGSACKGYWRVSYSYPMQSKFLGELVVCLNENLGENAISIERDIDNLKDTCLHELQHAIQSMFGRVLKLKDSLAGLPKRKIRSVDADAHGRPIGPDGKVGSTRISHSLRDVEFHTNLGNSLSELSFALKRCPQRIRRTVFKKAVGDKISDLELSQFSQGDQSKIDWYGRYADGRLRLLREQAKGKWRAYVSLLYKELVNRGILN